MQSIRSGEHPYTPILTVFLFAGFVGILLFNIDEERFVFIIALTILSTAISMIAVRWMKRHLTADRFFIILIINFITNDDIITLTPTIDPSLFCFFSVILGLFIGLLFGFSCSRISCIGKSCA